jgi:hypothetical protein
VPKVSEEKKSKMLNSYFGVGLNTKRKNMETAAKASHLITGSCKSSD